jgi:hypothetical protein
VTERTRHEQTTEAAPAAAAPRPVGGPPLLALQRKAGNRAAMAMLQRKGADAPPPAPLPPDLAARFGNDLRVQYSSPQAQQIGAEAFAQGNVVHVATPPEAPLPHEAVHVIQQQAGVQLDEAEGAEHEAEEPGASAPPAPPPPPR